MYPGQAPAVRRNMFNVVFVLDLARPASLHFISNTISMLINRSYPVRLGIVPIVESEESAKMARVLYHLTQNYGRVATMRFISSVREPSLRPLPSLIILYQVLELRGGSELELDWPHVQAQFEAFAASEEIKEGDAMSFDSLAGDASEVFEAKISKARAYAQRLGTDATSSPNGHTFINGKHYVLDDVRPTFILSTGLYLIVSGSELPKPAAVQCWTGTSVPSGEGKCFVLVLNCRLMGVFF